MNEMYDDMKPSPVQYVVFSNKKLDTFSQSETILVHWSKLLFSVLNSHNFQIEEIFFSILNIRKYSKRLKNKNNILKLWFSLASIVFEIIIEDNRGAIFQSNLHLVTHVF